MFFLMIYDLANFVKFYILFFIIFVIAFYVNNLAGYLTINKSSFLIFDMTLGNYESGDFEAAGTIMMLLWFFFQIIGELFFYQLL